LLWFGVFGGTAAWAGHLLLSYFVVGVGCDGVSGTLLNILLLGTTLVAGLVAIGSLFVAWDFAARTLGWRRFLSRFGLLLDGLGIAGVALAGVIPLALRPC
jgi:hypothetical protein